MITRKLQLYVLGTGGGNEPNDRKIVPINVIKIIHEHDVNDVKKVGIKCFLAQEAEMSSRPLISSNHRRRNFSLTRRTSSLGTREPI